jgi:PKD repeat protein
MKSLILKPGAFFLIFLVFSAKVFSQSFSEQTSIVLPGLANGSAAWADYDNDGDIDFLQAGFGADLLMVVKIYQNNGSNVFSDQLNIFSPAIPSSYYSYINPHVLWVDFDNDGFLDIIYNGPTAAAGNVVLIYRNEGNNTFLLKTTIDYLTREGFDIACGDYDNDGDQDVFIPCNTGSKLYQNQGGFVFNEQFSVNIEGVNKGVPKWGDYDNDGDLDLLLTGALSPMSISTIYQNQGNNTFVPQSSINLTKVIGGSAEWGDFNNDGYLDILLLGNNNGAVFKNNGNNTFSYLTGFAIAPVADGVGRWGDLDNDGDLDLIITGNSNNSNIITKIYINNGNSTFTESTGITIDAVKESSLDLFDYDNDGDLDILISGNKGSTRITKIFRNDSAVANLIPAAPATPTVVIQGADVILKWRQVKTDNTNSKSLSYNILAGTTAGGINLVSPGSSATGFKRASGMGNAQLDTTFVLRNLKKGIYYWKVQAVDNSFKGGTFSAQSSFTYSYSYQAFGLKAINTGAKESTLAWSRGNGANCIVFLKEANTGAASPVNNTTYTASSLFKSGSQIGVTGWYCVYKGTNGYVNVSGLKANTEYICQVFEYDGLAGAETYNLQVTTNSATLKTGIFTEVKASTLLPVNNSTFLYEQTSFGYWIDFDNDNDLDLLLVGQASSRLYRNDLNDVFTLMPVTLTTGFSAACADYNNDGYIDIFISANPSKLYKNNGNGTFTEQAGMPFPGLSYGTVGWGDYDNDGDMDIAVAGDTYTEGRVARVYRNNGDNTFTEQTLIALEGVAGVGTTTRWADYDNDGKLDLLLSGYNNSATAITKVYRNNGNGILAEQTGIVIPTYYGSTFDWGDYDGDGDLDLVVARSSTRSSIYRNNGNNTFTDQTTIPLQESRHGLVQWGDYDNDGDLDILMSGLINNGNPVTKIYRNNGDNTFTEDLNCQLIQAGWGSSTWGDYDTDGDLDIIITGISTSGAVSKIYRNDLGLVNVKPAAPTGMVSTVNKSDVTLTWKSVKSDNTPYLAMSYNIKAGTLTGGINTVNPLSSATGYRKLVSMGNGNLDTTFLLKNLPFGTYYWSVQAIDNNFAGGTFSSEGSFSVVRVQAKNLSATILDNNSIKLKWERGNGDRCVVFCKQTATGSSSPVNNTGYVADPEYGFGSQIGATSWYCVYNGRADSVSVTGLIYKKEYSFHIIEYTGTFGSEQYFPQVADGNPGVFSTSMFAEQAGIVLTDPKSNKIAWGDYNKDGFADLLIPGFPTRIFTNMGNNTFFQQTGISFSDIGEGAGAWGDYDNDGDLDIILTGATVNYPPSGPVTKIYRNDGANVFTEQTSISLTGVYYSSVDWGDYDNDGDLDILLTGATGLDPNFNPVSKIYRNNGNGTFTEQTQIVLKKVYKGSAVFGDYDNDGDLDIILNGAQTFDYYNSAISLIYKNNGNNTFTEMTSMNLPGFSISSSSWGDFDNDGDLDFLMTKMGLMVVMQNMGNDIFNQYLSVGLPYQGACSAAFGDYDNDGYTDIILTNPGLDTKIYHNTHGIKKSEIYTEWFQTINDAALASIGLSFVSWNDYDNDGDIDFLLGKLGTPVKIFRNNMIMKSGLFSANKTPAAPLSLSSANSPSGVILKWKPVKTDETPYKSMTYNVRIGTTRNNMNITPSHSDATGFRRVSTAGNAWTDTTLLMKNLPAGTYFWSVQAVDQGLKGGLWSAFDSLNVKNLLAFFSSDTVCQGTATTFTNQSVAYGDVIQSYNWNFVDGVVSTIQNPSHIFSTSGTKNVRLIVYSPTNSDTLFKQVIVKAKPPVDFSSSIACQGGETSLINNTSTAGLNITSWSWDYGDGKGSVSQNPLTHGYLSAGDYLVTLIASADNKCSAQITKTVTVAAIPVASISANTPLTFCSGDSVVLSVGSNPSYSYNWRRNNIPITTNATGSGYTSKIPGNYTVQVINNSGSCPAVSSPVTVTILNKPATPIIVTENYQEGKCPGETPAILKVDQPAAEYTYQWKRNGTPISNATKSTYQAFLQVGDYVVSVNQAGCITESAVKNIAYDDAPPKPQIYVAGPPVYYLTCTDTTAKSYKWYYNGTLLPNAKTNVFVANQKLGKYNVSISNAKGCFTMSDTVSIPKGTVGIELEEAFGDVVVYPNPTSGIVRVELRNQMTGKITIKIVSQGGKEVLNYTSEKRDEFFTFQTDISTESKGVYVLSIRMKGLISNKKIIIE